MLTIDGSYGEGGGQILRTSLALSLITGKPFHMEKIRAGRKKPGLMRQHLTAVEAAAEVGDARVSGQAIGSQEFTFIPQTIRCGRFRWAIGTAGSCALVLQAILPALMIADGPSEILLEGGTHNPFAPPYDFLDRTFLPLMARMGPQISADLEKPGYFPAGGGRMRVVIRPSGALQPLELLERGMIRYRRARATVSKLPMGIAYRELRVAAETLGLAPVDIEAVAIAEASGAGNILTIDIVSDALTEVFTGFGQRGVSAETVAARAVGQVLDYLRAEVPVGRHLADQLLVPLSVAGGGTFMTLPPSRHTMTNIVIIRKFMAISCDASANAHGQWTFVLRANGAIG